MVIPDGDPRWCHRCTSQLLMRLVATGQAAGVYPLDAPASNLVLPTTAKGTSRRTWIKVSVLRAALPTSSLRGPWCAGRPRRPAQWCRVDALGPVTGTRG